MPHNGRIKKGEKMKTRMKLLGALGLALGLACMGRAAWATGNTSDAVTVTISPNASYLVLVTTGSPAGGLNLGTMGVLTSTYTVNPTTVTVYSTYATTGLQLMGVVTQGTLAIDNTPGPVSGSSPQYLSTATDSVALYAVFTDTSVQS